VSNLIITALLNGVFFFAAPPPHQKVFDTVGQRHTAQDLAARLTPAVHEWYAYNGEKNIVLNELVDTFIAKFQHLETQHYLTQCTKPPLVIFDIDETVLSAYQSLAHQHSTSETITYVKASVIDAMTPLQPLQRLYTFLVARGMNIAFVSGRIDNRSMHTKIIQKLKASGFPIFTNVFLYPSGNTSIAQWKESTRNKLAQNYTIIATIDDGWQNLQGKNVGRWALWVPGYILTKPDELKFYARLVTTNTRQQAFTVAARGYTTAHP
jgi:hypothetical protein